MLKVPRGTLSFFFGEKMNFDELKSWLRVCEGLKLIPYTCTGGKLTIGVGRNLTDRGISVSEAEFMLENDILQCKKDLEKQPFYSGQPESVKCALINMCFNLGLPKLLKFKKMLMYLQERNYTKAAVEALDSEWAKQVGNRAKDVALIFTQATK